MPRKFRKQYGLKSTRKPKTYVPGWGGIAGRGIGYLSKTFTTKGSTANKALRLARKVANLVNIEEKIDDTQQTSVTFDYNGAIDILNNPAQAITDVGRIGDSIKVQKIHIKGTVAGSTTAGTLSNNRLILFWDEQNQVATAADLLETVGSTYSPFSPKHYDKRFRSNILYDQHFSLSTVPGSQAWFKNFEVSLPIGKHTQFSAASTTINTGALKFLYITDVVTSNLPNITYYARCFYTDD